MPISSVNHYIHQTNQELKEIKGGRFSRLFSHRNNNSKVRDVYINFYSNLNEIDHRFNHTELKKIYQLHNKIKKFAQSTNNKQLINLSTQFENEKLVPFKKLGKGKAKIVLEKKINKKESVYYIPVSSLFNAKKRELMNEIKTMEKINREFEVKNQTAPQNLATQYSVLKKSKSIGNKFTVKVEKGKDFETILSKEKISIQNRLKFSRDLANGLKELHSTNHVYGDLKPENCLVFNKDDHPILKIADFGKTVKLSDKSKKPYKMYSGNPRFMAPEGTLSKKSDVWGAGIILIRIFEEDVLDKKGNLFPSKEIENKSKFRGIEKYMVEHKNFLVSKKGGPASIITRMKARFTSPTSKQKTEQQRELHAYLKKLEVKLSQKYDNDEVKKLIQLIKRMTSPMPGRRPSMETVLKELNSINFN